MGTEKKKAQKRIRKHGRKEENRAEPPTNTEARIRVQDVAIDAAAGGDIDASRVTEPVDRAGKAEVGVGINVVVGRAPLAGVGAGVRGLANGVAQAIVEGGAPRTAGRVAWTVNTVVGGVLVLARVALHGKFAILPVVSERAGTREGGQVARAGPPVQAGVLGAERARGGSQIISHRCPGGVVEGRAEGVRPPNVQLVQWGQQQGRGNRAHQVIVVEVERIHVLELSKHRGNRALQQVVI